MSNLTEKDIDELVSAFPELNRGRKRVATPINFIFSSGSTHLVEFKKSERRYFVQAERVVDPPPWLGPASGSYSWVTRVKVEYRNHPPHKEALFRLMRPYL